MLDRDQLEAFAAVLEHQSFERAAIELNITRSAISQRVKSLEEALSAVLVIRERPILPTAAGEIVLRHVQALRFSEHDIYRNVLPKTGQCSPACLAIAVNADSLATWFGPLSLDILRQHRVALEIVVDDQDHTLPLLARGEVIGCISTEPKAAQGFVADALGAMEYRCVANPLFADRYFPDGFKLARVLSTPAIHFNRKDALHTSFLEQIFGFKVEKYIKHYFPSPVAFLEAICAGIGYGMIPTQQVEALLAAGALVELAPTHVASVDLYWHRWQNEPTITRTLTEQIVEAARRALEQPPKLK